LETEGPYSLPSPSGRRIKKKQKKKGIQRGRDPSLERKKKKPYPKRNNNNGGRKKDKRGAS